MSAGSHVLTLAKYPGGTIEPNLTAADEGSRILVVKAIDARNGDCTITRPAPRRFVDLPNRILNQWLTGWSLVR